MNWVGVLHRLREQREPSVLITVTEVRGHAPREAGAKMVVTTQQTWGSVGGGNLEATAEQRAHEMLEEGSTEPVTMELALNAHTRNEHGSQCCGGVVRLLLEPVPVPPAVAIFGLGHVGVELARILARHELELHLVDSRRAQVDQIPDRALADAVAKVERHHAPVPELVLGQIPAGCHVVIMTHDHAEDLALVDMALRSAAHLGSLGVIGSAAKWSRFRQVLREQGHTDEALGRVNCPIGIPSDPSAGNPQLGKHPAAIAVAVAADLLARLAATVPAAR